MTKQNLVFQGENADESIVFVLKRHPWTLFHSGLVIVILLLLMTAIFIKFQGSWVTSWAIFILLPITLYLAFRAWFLWTNSIYVLTNQRLIAVNQRGWFDRQVGEIALDDILKISHEVKGAGATMFNFGDVALIASGATEADLTLSAVYDPYEVQQRIIGTKRGGEPSRKDNKRQDIPENESQKDEVDIVKKG
jgi:hypothetical protein